MVFAKYSGFQYGGVSVAGIHGPPGAASLGLGVVTSLLESCGGALEVRAPGSGGAHVRIVVPVRLGPAGPVPAGNERAAP